MSETPFFHATTTSLIENRNPLLKKMHKKYPYESDESYVYKLCYSTTNQKTWIVIMQKLKETKTNEERKRVYEKMLAKFRADKLKVIEIFNAIDPDETTTMIVNRFNKKTLTYEVGKIVEADKYDENIDKVCSGGVHYFKSLDAAFYFNRPLAGCTGYWFDINGDGGIDYVLKYINGIFAGNVILL